MKYFHYTKRENLGDILSSQKLKAPVYVCDNFRDLTAFTSLYLGIKYNSLDDIVGIEFKTNDKFEESTDHNPALLGGARAFVSYKNVKIENIVNVFDFVMAEN